MTQSILEQVLKKIGWRGPESNGRKEQTSFPLRAWNTDSAEQKGYDAGKKNQAPHRGGYSGIAPCDPRDYRERHDRAGALAMFDQRRDGLSLVQNVLVDGGYTGDPFAAGVQSLLGASVEVETQ